MTNKEIVEQLENYVEDQPLTEKERDLLDTIYSRLDIFEQMNRPFREEAQKCRAVVVRLYRSEG